MKEPKNTAQIQKAISHQQRLKFHADINLEKAAYHDIFVSWVGTFLTANDKLSIFKHMLKYPLNTNEVVDAISDEYVKVFSAQDSFKRITFSDPAAETDFNQYEKNINLKNFFEKDGFKAMISAPSSILIVDLPSFQNTDLPEPYFYLLDIEKVIDIDFNNKGDVNYIAFRSGENFAVFDDEYYRLFKKVEDQYYLIAESMHDLGFCPARPLWSDEVNKDQPANKQSPITHILSRLDWFLYFETSKQNLDLYAAYPINWSLISKCNYRDSDGNSCEGGFVKKYDTVSEKDVTVPCPICASNSIVGPGSLIEKPIPKGDNKIESGAPAGIISVDRDSLDYNVDESERLKNGIIASATGKSKVISKEAVNEDQVKSQYESQTNVLNWIARNFEKSEKWLIDTICQIRYGSNYIGSEISWGTIFYLESTDDAIADFETSKKAGVPTYLLIDKLIAIEETQTRGNSTARERLRILRSLEPYPDMSIVDAKNNGIDTVDKQGFVLKLNFANFVSRFEQQYGNIVEFGKLLPFESKLSRINQAFATYLEPFLNSTPPSNELRTTVGGLTGMIEIVKAVSEGAYDYNGAVALVADRFGLTEEEAKKQLGEIKKAPVFNNQ